MIPHPERVLFPGDGITRAELALYYARLAAAFLPHWRDRALTLRRWPRGLSEPGFYQKFEETRRGQARHPIAVRTVEDVLRWVGLGAIEFHVPLAAANGLQDWAVMDLDPHPPADWPDVVEAAQVVAVVLTRLRCRYLLKTSGRRGVHFYLPILPMPPAVVTDAVAAIGRLVTALRPDLTTMERSRAERGPRVYLDYLQNGPGRSMAGVYTVRALPGAPVSWPVSLAELPAVGSDKPRLRSVGGRPVPQWSWDPPNDLARVIAPLFGPEVPATLYSTRLGRDPHA